MNHVDIKTNNSKKTSNKVTIGSNDEKESNLIKIIVLGIVSSIAASLLYKYFF